MREVAVMMVVSVTDLSSEDEEIQKSEINWEEFQSKIAKT